MKTSETTPTPPGAEPDGSAQGVSRRRLVRAGLSAAPVVAALKSNTVLAGALGGGQGNGVTTSAFASLQANQGRVSNARYKTDCEVRTPAEWKNRQSDLKKKKFQECGFVANPAGRYGLKVTLADVLGYEGNDRDTVLARYVVASYLTALEFHDDRDVLALTTSQCKAIWNGRGVWSPFAGAQWDYAQTTAYFETIYGARRFG
jgi:hypothetical protein